MSAKRPGRPWGPIQHKSQMAARLQLLFPGAKRRRLERIIGKGRDAVHRLMVGLPDGTEPSNAELVAICMDTGCSIEWLSTGEGEPFGRRAAEEQQPYDRTFKPYVRPLDVCPLANLALAGADTTGGRIVLDAEQDGEPYTVPEGWGVVRVVGDSMREIAWDGQSVILAGPEREARPGDLVVVMLEGRGCLFKRLGSATVGPAGRVTLLSASGTAPEPSIEVPVADVLDMRVVVGVFYE